MGIVVGILADVGAEGAAASEAAAGAAEAGEAAAGATEAETAEATEAAAGKGHRIIDNFICTMVLIKILRPK